jgi:hypothetical protein
MAADVAQVLVERASLLMRFEEPFHPTGAARAALTRFCDGYHLHILNIDAASCSPRPILFIIRARTGPQGFSPLRRGV